VLLRVFWGDRSFNPTMTCPRVLLPRQPLSWGFMASTISMTACSRPPTVLKQSEWRCPVVAPAAACADSCAPALSRYGCVFAGSWAADEEWELVTSQQVHPMQQQRVSAGRGSARDGMRMRAPATPPMPAVCFGCPRVIVPASCLPSPVVPTETADDAADDFFNDDPEEARHGYSMDAVEVGRPDLAPRGSVGMLGYRWVGVCWSTAAAP
jgi:hypothetical protein